MSDYDRPEKNYLFTKSDAMVGFTTNYTPRAEQLGGSTPAMAEQVREALATKQAEVKGLKHDQGKEPLSLLSRIWLLGVGRVLEFGARKYASHNWRGGIERSRLISACLRHLLAYNEGQDLDPETGLNHLDHASCCLMFARELHETRPDLDDRFKGDPK